MEIVANGLVFHPENPELLYRLSCYHYILGNIKEAYRVITTALEKNVKLCETVFEYAPAMSNDRHIIELIDLYKNQI